MLALAALVQTAFLSPAIAQDNEVTPGMVSPGGTGAKPTPSAAFDITVRAPDGIRQLLEKHLELQRYRAVTDLDDNELARLVVLADKNIRDLVGTLGYFSPEITITQDGQDGQSAAISARKSIVITVSPGEPALAAFVDVTFSGDIATSQDPGAVAQRRDIQRGWQLPPGQPFTQDAWDSAKTQSLRALTTRRYPTG